MFLTMGDIGVGVLEVGATARGAFTAALPKPPYLHMWERIPNTGETPPGGGLSTYLYKLVRYEADPAPVDVSKLMSTEAEIIAEMNAKDPDFVKLQQTVARNEAQAQANATAAAAAAAARAFGLSKPWYKQPMILGGIGVGVLLAGVAAVLLMQD